MEAPLIIGSLAFITTAVNLLLDFPAQTLASLRNRVPAGLLVGLKLSTLAMYGCWAAYGWARGDVLMLYGQGLALISSMLLLGQLVWIRTRKASLERT